MFKETMTYIDFDGNERTEDFYFNLTKAEIAKMDLKTPGGMEAFLQRIIASNDPKEIVTMFEELVQMAYGAKSPDGRRFIKTPEVLAEFTQTEAYSDMFIRLASDAEYASKFIEGIVPKIESKEKPNTVNGVEIKGTIPPAVSIN